MDIHKDIKKYRSGTDRNEQSALSHTYAEDKNGDLWPMCGYGWNRSNGHSFSIFRNEYGTQGKCKLCRKNLSSGKPFLTEGFEHKTKWL
jgi:hypothetical protein